MQKIFRYVIPVDDYDHELEIGEIYHVGAKPDDIDNIHVWASPLEAKLRYFRAYATGQETPDDAVYIGTVVASRNIEFAQEYVWHLFERTV